jgi:glycosyltransferase involved in cell wall biosynthesis
MPEATIVIPAYNEEKNIRQVLTRIKKISGKYEIVVVDDGSSDRTAQIAKKEGANVLSFGKNRGKSAACIAGARKARSGKIVFIDADLQLMPEEIPKFVKALDTCDLAIGVRNMGSIPVQRRMANAIARKMLPNRKDISDVLCGFRAMRKRKFEELELKGSRYEFEFEMLLGAIKKKFKISQIPVRVSYENYRGMSPLNSLKLLLFILKNGQVVP